MRRLVLKEHQALEVDELSAEEAGALRLAFPSLEVTLPASHPRRYGLRPGAEVGSVVLPTLSVQVLPKIQIANLLFLLSYSRDPIGWRNALAHFASKEDLFEALVPGFTYLVRELLRFGLVQGYRTVEEAWLGVRGRIRFEDQLRTRFGRFPPAEVRFDDFSVDTDENRLILAALCRLEQLPIRSVSSRAALRSAINGFAGVTPIRYERGRLPTIRYTRMNQRCRPAVELAKLVLAATSFDLGDSTLQARGFVVDMNQVFEDFVATALREALGTSESAFPQNVRGKSLCLDEQGKIKLEPDVSWWDGPECRFVGDVAHSGESGQSFRSNPDSNRSEATLW